MSDPTPHTDAVRPSASPDTCRLCREPLCHHENGSCIAALTVGIATLRAECRNMEQQRDAARDLISDLECSCLPYADKPGYEDGKCARCHALQEANDE